MCGGWGWVGVGEGGRVLPAPPAPTNRTRRRPPTLSTRMPYPGCCEACFKYASACLISSCARASGASAASGSVVRAAGDERGGRALRPPLPPPRTGLGASVCWKASCRGLTSSIAPPSCARSPVLLGRHHGPAPQRCSLWRCESGRWSGVWHGAQLAPANAPRFPRMLAPLRHSPSFYLPAGAPRQQASR